MKIHLVRYISYIILFVSSSLAFADDKMTTVKIDKIGNIAKLPSHYPEHWVFAHDSAFMHMVNGHYMVLDPSAEKASAQYKGMVDASFISSFSQSKERNEFYVIETFYSRGSRGERTDVVTIYDPATLLPKGEVILPKDRLRMISMPEKYSSQIIGNKFLLVTNLSPATSISIIDLDKKAVVSVVETPGCVLTYPTGKLGFSSICASGALKTFVLDESGKVSENFYSKTIFNAYEKPAFEKPVIIDNVAYFIGFEGKVYNVDLSEKFPKIGKSWSLLEEGETDWRPGGWQLNASDDNGQLYVLMHPKGYNGSHKDGGSELWVYNPKTGKRLNKVILKNWGVSVVATHGNSPYVLITNSEMQVDVYHKDKYIRTLFSFGQETPFIIHASEM